MPGFSFTSMQRRKSYTGLGKIYFWTASIHQWYPLLQEDACKEVILGSLRWLSNHQKVNVYGFSIMPTHIHLIWQLTAQNGKESPKASFMKFTAHSLRKYLDAENRLHLYQVSLSNKRHEIWQPDALGIEIYSRKVARQKLEYIHRNPVAGKWRLAKDDISYHYSSALFYETGEDRFGFLKNIFTVFDGR